MNTIVAIVGRPNVGKSTLFNRLAKSNSAIVDPTSGVTRDRHYSSSDWNGKNFTIIDTGGYVSGGDDKYESEIDKQVILALDECDKIIFVVDVNESNNSSDKEISKLLRKTDKPVIVAVNKADKNKLINDSLEFYNLGFDTLFAISAINGSGTGDLLDKLVEDINDKSDFISDDLPSFSVVGRPNAGKSSYINTLIGEERNIVKNEPGTTWDAYILQDYSKNIPWRNLWLNRVRIKDDKTCGFYDTELEPFLVHYWGDRKKNLPPITDPS